MKILLVEDTRSMAAVMTARLADMGFEVVLAENGRIAVEMFTQGAPDLVLMDIEMPVMDGFEATSRIRAFESSQQWAWTPIIFLTASDLVDNLVHAIEAGGDDYLTKLAPEVVLQAKMKAMTRIATLRQQLAAANRKLEDLASKDGLTGLCNRRSMDLRTDAHWDRAQRSGAPFGLLMLDVDNFKKFNDHYGHQMGDDCLRSVANAIDLVVGASNQEGFTSNAYAARYGGEEFAVVIPECTRTAYVTMAARLLDGVRALTLPHEKNPPGIVTVSIGGEWLKVARDSLATLFRQADANLYKAKVGGRDRVELGTVT